MGNYGRVKPWVQTAGDTLGPMFGITDIGGYRAVAADMTGHPAGLALDFMCNQSQGDRLAEYAKANAAALNVKYIIWWQRIWSVERQSEGWRPMANRGSPTQNHLDHVHISFMATATGNAGGLPTVQPINNAVGLPVNFVTDATGGLVKIVSWWLEPTNVLRAAAFVSGAIILFLALSRITGVKAGGSNVIVDVIKSNLPKESPTNG